MRGQATTPQLLWESTGPSNSFYGTDLAAVGDMNGDGLAEVVVGAARAFNNAGAVRVLSGPSGDQVMQFVGPSTGWFLGFRVAGAGDITGDGVPDLLVGSTGPGARLYSGASGTVVYEWLLGYTWVDGIGDQNGDGITDALVGAGGSYGNSGSAFVYSGADGSAPISLYGPISDGIFGAGVGSVGDLDGDGVEDFVVGAPVHGAWSSLPGHAYVFAGGSGTLLDTLSSGALYFDDFGRDPTGLGDVTGDGIPDFMVTGAWPPPSSPPIGNMGAYLYSGADRSLVTVVTMVLPENFITSIGRGGDVDGDGVPDLIIGSPGSPPLLGGYPTGVATLRSGSDWSLLAVMAPPTADGLGSGNRVCAVPDVTGDDYPEVAVSAPGTNPPFPVGKVRLYSGAPPGIAVSGSGCSGSSPGVPRIAATGSPKVGASFTINLSRTVPSTPAFLLLGFSNAAWWGTPLPFDLAPFGLPGCSLLVSPDLVFGVTTSAFGPGNGRAVFTVSIPNVPALAGAQFHGQWYVANAFPAVVPGSMTRAISCTVQP